MIAAPVYKPIIGTGATDQKVSNLSLATSGVEGSLSLSTGVKEIMFRARTDGATLQFCFVSGESGTNYITLKPSCVATIPRIEFTGKTIYIQSDTNSTIVELLELIS